MISVVMLLGKNEIIYNKTIQSLLLQNCKIEELIIITDSNYNPNIEKEITENINIVFKKSDSGFVESLLDAIRECKAEYIGIINNGDVWKVDKLNRQVEELNKSDANICLCLNEKFENSKLLEEFRMKINMEEQHKLKSLFFYNEFFDEGTGLFKKNELENITNTIIKEKYMVQLFKKNILENKLVYIDDIMVSTENIGNDVKTGLEKIRLNNEKYIAYEGFFENIDNQLLCEVFEENLVYNILDENYIRQCEETFLYIECNGGSQNAWQKMIGVKKLYELYDIPQARKVLRDKYLISNEVLEQLNIICDINNASDITCNETQKQISALKTEQLERCKRRNNFIRSKTKISTMPQHYEKIVEKMKKKEKIKIAYFVLESSVFKYEELYKLFDKNQAFEQAIVICPIIRSGIEYTVSEFNRSYNYFLNNEYNYNIIKAYDVDSDEYIDIKSTYNPDIVFFCSPYNKVPENLFIYNFEDRLTCFTPYAYHVADMHQLLYNQNFHNLLWRFYIESDMHKKMAVENMDNKGVNAVVTGHPGTDGFLYNKRIESDIWKVKDDKVKRIIWAPHHSIEDDDKYSPKTFSTYSEVLVKVKDYKAAEDSRVSNFTKIYDDMIVLAEKYKDTIQIAFKPHPILKRKLYEHRDWGVERTDAYYAKWKSMSNTQLEESGYVELFNSSDAMIFDSGSFIAEYLFCGKPAMYTRNREDVEVVLNEFGKMALNIHYQGHNMSDIYEFIDMLIRNEDTKKNERDTFYKQYLKTKDGKSASQNIYEDICNELNK